MACVFFIGVSAYQAAIVVSFRVSRLTLVAKMVVVNQSQGNKLSLHKSLCDFADTTVMFFLTLV